MPAELIGILVVEMDMGAPVPATPQSKLETLEFRRATAEPEVIAQPAFILNWPNLASRSPEP